LTTIKLKIFFICKSLNVPILSNIKFLGDGHVIYLTTRGRRIAKLAEETWMC
jgi:hypothetical protein